jgi:3-methyladenine DNA glycosylase AlkD
MGQVFQLAKEFIEMPPAELDRLLDSDIHEVRAGAMSIMDQRTRRNRTPESVRKQLFALYLRRHDRINNWDLVDLGAPFVVGRYLYDRPRDVIYELARSPSLWERRTAIVSTSYFIRQGDVADTFGVAEVLLHNGEDLVQKAVGGWLRAAGGHDRERLAAFLDLRAATMPRTMLRCATEHFDQEERARYRAMRSPANQPGGTGS